MTVQDLINTNLFQLINAGDDLDRDITRPFCCDLLSVAMGKAPAGCAWITVMSNINTLATSVDEVTLAKAKMQGITLFTTGLPIFDAALSIYQQLNP